MRYEKRNKIQTDGQIHKNHEIYESCSAKGLSKHP